jgi:hypothetical protein
MNIGGLLTCRQNGKDHFIGQEFKSVRAPFRRTIRQFPIANPQRCRVSVTAVFDGSRPQTGPNPFASPGRITVTISWKK